jgi:hypothetical protein
MKLRICDGEHESIVPASLEMVEQAFATRTPVRIGTEITRPAPVPRLHRGDGAVGLVLSGYRPGSSMRQMSLSRSEAVK